MTLKEIKTDRSGKFLKESFVKKTYFNIYEKIMSWSKGQDIFFKDRVFLYFFKIKTPPNCPTCSSQLKLKSFINLEFKEIGRKDPNKWYFELGKLDLVCNDNSYNKYFICDAGYNSLRWIC